MSVDVVGPFSSVYWTINWGLEDRWRWQTGQDAGGKSILTRRDEASGAAWDDLPAIGVYSKHDII
jgi:hypothetical protein